MCRATQPASPPNNSEPPNDPEQPAAPELDKLLADSSCGVAAIERLNFMEDAMASFLPSIDTLTFFEGRSPTRFLTERVTAIIRENPWLAGSLKRGPRGVELVVPSDVSAASAKKHFHESQCCLQPGMSLCDLLARVAPHKVKAPGLPALDEPLFKVVILRSGVDSFALLVSLHHALGDGCTFYQLYGMLGMYGKPQALSLSPVNALFGPAFALSISPSLPHAPFKNQPFLSSLPGCPLTHPPILRLRILTPTSHLP